MNKNTHMSENKLIRILENQVFLIGKKDKELLLSSIAFLYTDYINLVFFNSLSFEITIKYILMQ